MISLLWDGFSHQNLLWSWFHSTWPSYFSLLMAVLFVLAYICASRWLPRFFQWSRELEKIFRQILTPLSYFQIFLLALISGFIEEWFFRGVLLHHFGLMMSSLLFGLGHFIPSPHLWMWGVWAFFFGIVFGLFYQVTQSLLLVALIHFSINLILLLLLNHRGHQRPALLGSD